MGPRQHSRIGSLQQSFLFRQVVEEESSHMPRMNLHWTMKKWHLPMTKQRRFHDDCKRGKLIGFCGDSKSAKEESLLVMVQTGAKKDRE